MDGVRKVSAADVQRVVKRYLTQNSRAVEMLIRVKPDTAAGSGK